jgi:hypothetical protein
MATTGSGAPLSRSHSYGPNLEIEGPSGAFERPLITPRAADRGNDRAVAHRAELDRCVLELHLEHAGAEIVERDGSLAATGRPESRWWFTSRIERLEAAVRDAVEVESLGRSLMLRPDTFGEKPTTDGADFFPAGVPIVHHLAAPFYLFDAMDTLDKIHRPSLVPITRAAIRIIESTAGVSAAAMRADTVRV